MRDREVVASIVAGDPAGLAEAYDKYASVLYTYSKTFLHEPADAADVVHDTFVIAAGNLDRLRDPERLRPWLYAVTRNLCLRKLRAEKAVAAEWSDIDLEPRDREDADIGGDAERAELRALMRTACGGLNPGERDIIELRLWQGLDAAEAAAVLGITRGHAHALMSRGRDQLTASVGALLVARTGREDCATLDRLLSGWDGELTVLLRKRLTRHIEHCDSCSDRKRRELQPALLSLWPAGVLAGEALARHAMHVVAAPADLKAQVLAAAASKDAPTAAKAAGLTGRGLTENGFPRPAAVHRIMPARGAHPHLTLWAAAGTAAVVVVAGAVYAGTHLLGGPGERPGAALGLGGTVTTSAPGHGPGGTVPPGSSGAQPGSGSPGATGPGSSGGPGSGPGTSGGHGGSPGSGGGGVVPVVTVKPSPGSSATPTSGASSSAPSSAPSSSSPAAPPPSSSSPAAPTSSPPPASSSPPAQAPVQGTLTVSPSTVVLTPLLGSSLTLTAEGGPVSWSISEPASLLGELIVSPSSGTLAAGQSTTVSISVSGLASLDTTLTVSPGGHAVTVVLGVL